MRLVQLTPVSLHSLLIACKLICRKLRKHRQGNDFGRSGLGHRKISPTVVQRSVGFLQMQGNWVVNAGAYARLIQMGHHAVTIIRSDHIEVIHGSGPGRLIRRKHSFVLRQKTVVFGGPIAALRVPPPKMS